MATITKIWTITVTNLTAISKTIGPYDTDSTGYLFTTIVPDQTGIWKFQAHYPGGYVNFLGALNGSVPPAVTNVFSLTVQDDPVPTYPGAPLPSEYWEFPNLRRKQGME